MTERRTSHVRRFVRSAWLLLAFQGVAAAATIGVTGWSAFYVADLRAERDALRDEVDALRAERPEMASFVAAPSPLAPVEEEALTTPPPVDEGPLPDPTPPPAPPVPAPYPVASPVPTVETPRAPVRTATPERPQAAPARPQPAEPRPARPVRPAPVADPAPRPVAVAPEPPRPPRDYPGGLPGRFSDSDRPVYEPVIPGGGRRGDGDPPRGTPGVDLGRLTDALGGLRPRQQGNDRVRDGGRTRDNGNDRTRDNSNGRTPGNARTPSRDTPSPNNPRGY